MRRGRTGATTGRSINGMRQSDNPRLAHLRGFAGAKMARKAEQHTLGLRHGA